MCAIEECINYKRQLSSKSFYRFPKNKEICRQWVVWSKRADLEDILNKCGPERLYRNYVICSDHFLQTDFRNKNLLSQGLWPHAVPSVLPGEEPQKEIKSEKEIKLVPLTIKDSENLPVPGHSPVAEDSCEPKYLPVPEDLPTAEGLPEPGHLSIPEGLPVAERGAISESTQVCKRCPEVKLKVRRLQKTLHRYRKVNTALKTRIKELKEKLASCESASRSSDNSVAGVFMDRQVMLSNKKPHGRRYSEVDMNFAVTLHSLSPKSYQFLQSHFCLPTTRSLRRCRKSKASSSEKVLDMNAEGHSQDT